MDGVKMHGKKASSSKYPIRLERKSDAIAVESKMMGGNLLRP